ncbi:RNA 2',3'-cyclic phosphodiesterase [Candidatus Spongiisocius sp.]|uniref:RNA 2',3'-cyclic phosphodiesterase n=1 Tax=Candidatus Spongiisocius sp. TaxID=3101273 RepID=UPI003B59B863
MIAPSLNRYFVALSLRPEIRFAVRDWRDALDLPGRPVPPEKFHVTLRFVGRADRVGQERVMGALDAADLGPSFPYRIGGLGAFPRPRKATVAWAGLEGDGGRLSVLASVADEAVASAGFGHEERPFRAHLTLARIRPPMDLRAAVIAAPPARIRACATEVVFYRSRTAGSRTTYHPLERFSLARAG